LTSSKEKGKKTKEENTTFFYLNLSPTELIPKAGAAA
jgi:hypothetical protein